MNVATTAYGVDLTDQQFHFLSDLAMELCGINLHNGKRSLVRARLAKRLRHLGMADFGQYIAYLQQPHGRDEYPAMLDALTTNVTEFFREPRHFDYLRNTLIPRWAAAKKDRRLRIWSAGCSCGQEPYSLAITLAEASQLAGWNLKILATDLSTDALRTASEGLYTNQQIAGVPAQLRSRYFRRIGRRPDDPWSAQEPIRNLITFGRLNLMEPWPMRGPFDAIFCRNVMIYFDKPTQLRLVSRFAELLAPKAALFVGHSESLANARNRFEYIESTIYRLA